MFHSDDIEWAQSLPSELRRFLSSMRGKTRRGFFRFTYSGDFFGEGVLWGLGNSVFAGKILSIASCSPQDDPLSQGLKDFTLQFRARGNYIFDRFLFRRSLVSIVVDALRNRRFTGIGGHALITAETRQALSMLKSLGHAITDMLPAFPCSDLDIERHFWRWSWRNPWEAGSHVSHLLFFLSNSAMDGKARLVAKCCRLLDSLQNAEDGLWYRGSPANHVKINGAMKVISGLETLQGYEIKYAHRIIDTCLASVRESSACDQLDILYVLSKTAAQNTEYRRAEVQDFAISRLHALRSHYFEQHGGFSFYPGQSIGRYYFANIARQKNEPDMHGTVMCAWAAALAARLLGLKGTLLREIRT